MNPVQIIRSFFEKQAFGVCTTIGEKMGMRTSVIRLFFIYSTFLTIGSPIILYMIMAFWLKMKDYVQNKRTSVWDM